MVLVDALRGQEGAVGDQGGGFHVDPVGVRDVAARLRADIDSLLAPEFGHAIETFGRVPVFGQGTASPDVHGTADVYSRQAARLVDLLEFFVHYGEVLARTAERVAATYQQADKMTTLEFNELMSLVSATVAKDRQDAAGNIVVDPKTGRPI